MHLFEFVATADYTPYLCVPAAIKFRQVVCGGEEAIRDYCYGLAQVGGQYVADILGTEVMDNKSGSLSKCCFANVKLPLKFVDDDQEEMSDRQSLGIAEIGRVQKWLNLTAVKEFDTYLQIAFHSGYMWVRLSAQIYLEQSDFEWLAPRLKGLCSRVRKGDFRS